MMSPSDREALRAAQLAAIPKSYSPFVACVFLVRDVKAWEWLTLPLTWMMANAAEWRMHKDWLHKRTPPFHALYDRHTPVHHMIYVHGDMEIKDWRELKMVLIPAWAGLALFFGVLPLAAALYYFVSPNVAYLFEATCVFYVGSYELLHMSYHLPKSSRVGRNPLIRALSKHHSIHHDPRMMQKWNMNVTVPLWDVVRRTKVNEDALPAREAQSTVPAEVS
jgi:hypothetical protein